MYNKKIFNFLNLFFRKKSDQYNNEYENNYSDENLLSKFGNKYDDVDNLDLEEISNEVNKLKKKNKKFSFLLLFLIGASSVIGIGCLIYVVTYYVNQKNIKETDSYTSSSFQQDTSTAAVSSMKYLLNRTLSINFTIKNDTEKWALSVNGTGWIVDRNTSNGDYYIATNIHVGTILTQVGQNVTESTANGTEYNLESAKIDKTNIGFINENLINNSNGTDLYHYSPYQISYVTLNQTPTVFYMANTKYDTNFANIFNSSTNEQVNDTLLAKNNSVENASAGLDFMILKMNFNNIGSTNKSIFFNWLNNYTPTQFCTKNEIQSRLDSNASTYYMGGFPAIGKNGSSSWVGFSDMSGVILTESSNGTIANIKKNDANKSTSQIIGPFSGLNYYSKSYNSDVEQSVTSFYKNGNEFEKYNNYNVGQYISLNAKSSGGSSGSMIITNVGTEDNPEFKVIGIYWGYTSYANGLSSGKGTLLTSTSYKFNSSITNNTSISIGPYDIVSNIQTLISNDKKS